MFELSGYWQKVGGLNEEEASVYVARGSMKRRGTAGCSETRALEKHLNIPTFIRHGRKINEMCGLA